MLGPWRSHADYQQHTFAELSAIASFNPYALLEYECSISKLLILNLDPLLHIIAPLYSNTGRPSTNQPEIFRSLVLMNNLGYTLSEWVDKLIVCWVVVAPRCGVGGTQRLHARNGLVGQGGAAVSAAV